MSLVRLAITEEQIVEHDLPTKPRKATDRRAQHVRRPLRPRRCRRKSCGQLLRAAVEEFLPPDALEVAKAAEESEREHLKRWAALMANGAAT